MTEREDRPVYADVEPTVEQPAISSEAQAPLAPGSTSASALAGDSSHASGSAVAVSAAAPTAPASALAEEELAEFVPARVGCRTDLRGWAGAHLHGAVRPRRRAAGRGRPPGRWC